MNKLLKFNWLFILLFTFWVDPLFGSNPTKVQLLVYADSMLIESKLIGKVDSTTLSRTKILKVNEFANAGFLFCKAYYDSSLYAFDTLKLWVKKGPQIRMNRLVMGPTETKKTANPKLIQAVTQLKQSAICQLDLIEKFDMKIENSGLYTLSKSSEFNFSGDSVAIFTYLEAKQRNSINGIIGFLPSDNNKTVFSGDFSLALSNVFNYGEELRAKWQSYKPESQQASLSGFIPYLFYSPIGLKADLTITKNDSSFLASQQQFSTTYSLAPNHRIAANFTRKVSSDLSSEQQENTSTFSGFGIEYFLKKSDNLFIPRKATFLNLRGTAGTKTINSEVYTQLLVQLNFTVTRKISNYFGWTTKLLAEGVFSEKIIRNEQFLFGGFNSLRGFNELNFLASQYATAQNEFQFHLDSGSYLFTLFDVGVFKGDSNSDTPFGFGVGYALATKNGLFSINYALGQSKIQPLRFQSSKVHFGFIGNL